MNGTNQGIALVTGANKSIGFEVAKKLARAGCTVYLGARKLQAGKDAAAQLATENLEVHPIELDLLRQETIVAAAARIEKEHGRLDILVNNAGIISDARVSSETADGPPSKASLQGVENTMKTNFFGTLAVTQAMLPCCDMLPRKITARALSMYRAISAPSPAMPTQTGSTPRSSFSATPRPKPHSTC